ncbi:MAG: hypothetical protein RLT87_03090 [Gammaproteobacteria bacterium]
MVRNFYISGFTIALILPMSVGAEGLRLMEDWNIFGSNTLRGSVYDASGNGAGSPYPNEGDMYYDELSVFANTKNSEYDTMRAEFTGVYNANDDYRAPDFGVVPERMSFVRENGDNDLPYRFEVGDYFAYYSYLTLQSSLKGFQLEMQPTKDYFGYKHSVVMTSGAVESNWRDLTPSDNWTNGVSWLMQDDASAISFNLVYNYRDQSFQQGTLDRGQTVISTAYERIFDNEDFTTTLEMEYAHFTGDHNGLAGAASGQERNGNGYFAELRGRSKSMPWDYRLRFDSYDQDFQPTGAIVSSDRRSAELHSGWVYDSGIRMRGRIQFFNDGVETTNQTSTRTYGINFSGPLLHRLYSDVTGTLDAFLQQRDDENGFVDQFTRNINLSLSKPLPYDWYGRASFFFQNLEDESPTNNDSLTRQASVSADHGFNLLGLNGTITPGIMLRTIRRGLSESTDLNPTLALNLRGGPHSFRMDYGTLAQNRVFAVSGADITTHTLNFDYRFTRQQHVFGIESNFFARDPVPGETTDAYRISAYWTYEFDKPAVDVAQRRETAIGLVPDSGDLSLTLRNLAPGKTEDQIQLILSNANVRGGINFANLVVYEYPLFDEIVRRQRLALEYSTGLLERSGLIIDFDNVGDRDSVVQTFERVREILIRRLGNPTRTIEEGEFSVNFIADINSQRLVRLIEWQTATGTIRFGIPRRLDNQVRMEVQHASSFPPFNDTLWSIESVR